MTSTTPAEPAQSEGKGLKGDALGVISSVVIGVASTAPAYSLAATLGFIVVGVGVQAPLIVILAFIPMLFTAIGYQELNKADPDCGTTFTWATRAFGPKTGWIGGWGIIAADILVMASLAQVAGQYGFLLFGADKIGRDPTSSWVLLVGVIWIIVMTVICYLGTELSAKLQQVLLSIELVVLVLFVVIALVRVYTNNAVASSIKIQWSWFNPLEIDSFSTFFRGLLLMLFIYWGWDSAVSVNEETADPGKTPGRAAIISTVMLVVTYTLVTLAAQSYAGVGKTGIGLGNEDNSSDVLSVLGNAVFGSGMFGSIMTHVLILMVLTSAAASTQTTILPTARTALSMGVYRALPKQFAEVHPKFKTPTWATLGFGGISIVLYVILNYTANAANVIADCVTALGMMIAFYYGLTGFTCAWYYRKTLRNSARDLWMQGILPTLGGIIMYFALAWSLHDNWLSPAKDTAASYTGFNVPGLGWVVGGAFVLGVGTMLIGVFIMLVLMRKMPAFFRGETLNRDTKTLVPDVAELEIPPDLA